MSASSKHRQPAAAASQSEAFIAKARELEAVREAGADTLMGRMAKMKPEPRAKAPPRPKVTK